MRAIICDICGKVMNSEDFIDYDVMKIGDSFDWYDVCKNCRDDVRNYVKQLTKERKGEEE